MLEARNLWELVEARAEASPDQRMLVDEAGRSLTFGEYRDAAERAAAGFAERGVVAGDVVSWQLPTWIESVVLVQRAVAARRGAEPDPADLPGAGGRLRDPGRPAPSSSSSRRSGAGSTSRRWPGRLAEENGGTPEVLTVGQGRCPRATWPRSRRPPLAEDEPPVRWLFSTSGTTADPKVARHTDKTIMATARGMSDRLDYGADDQNGARLPVHPHRRHHVAVLQPPHRRRQHPHGGVRPERRPPRCSGVRG